MSHFILFHLLKKRKGIVFYISERCHDIFNGLLNEGHVKNECECKPPVFEVGLLIYISQCTSMGWNY